MNGEDHPTSPKCRRVRDVNKKVRSIAVLAHVKCKVVTRVV